MKCCWCHVHEWDGMLVEKVDNWSHYLQILQEYEESKFLKFSLFFFLMFVITTHFDFLCAHTFTILKKKKKNWLCVLVLHLCTFICAWKQKTWFGTFPIFHVPCLQPINFLVFFCLELTYFHAWYIEIWNPKCFIVKFETQMYVPLLCNNPIETFTINVQ
jgi:hypothetical protein